MNIQKKLKELDDLFQKKEIEKVGVFLKNSLREAEAEKDMPSLITLLNEMIGYCRDTGKYAEAMQYSREVLIVLEQEGLTGTLSYATTVLNIANAERAAGRLEDSLKHYEEVLRIYQGNVDLNDYRYAALYNNMSLLYQEMNQFEQAAECLNKALPVIMQYSEERIALAVTHSNLAASLLRLDKDKEAMDHLYTALNIFEQDSEKDYHYSAALAVMGEAKFRAGELKESESYYEKALKELEGHVGRTPAYDTILENLEQVRNLLFKNENGSQEKGLALCEAYYEAYGRQMLHEQFPEYEERIAVGLAGEGSDCFGFDDVYSADHDFGPGFCMWLTEADYKAIGPALKSAYEKLPKTFHGKTRLVMPHGKNRTGVFTIQSFYQNLLGNAAWTAPEKWTAAENRTATENGTAAEKWSVEEWRLAAATNGKIFRDEFGEFTKRREQLLAYYPDIIWKQKIATELVMMAQLGQYNYKRMLKRGEKVTAEIILADYMKHTMQLVYLLNRKYAPYYKWLHHGMTELTHLPEVMDILNAIADMPKEDERIPDVIEIIAALVIEKLKELGLVERMEKLDKDEAEETYLEVYANRITEKQKAGEQKMSEKQKPMDEITALTEKIVQLEWEAFDKVKNEGGRADCQDDWNTFSIMRRSQYLNWTAELLKSFIADFEQANAMGLNLIAEKYGRMEESTAPEEYAKIKDRFPAISAEKKQIIEEIVRLQVAWMEEFAEKYPKTASIARSIHTYEDNLYNTSYETYLRGEISTYSDQTLLLYGRFVAELAQENKNLVKMINERTALAYGYQSLDTLEAKLDE